MSDHLRFCIHCTMYTRFVWPIMHSSLTIWFTHANVLILPYHGLRGKRGASNTIVVKSFHKIAHYTWVVWNSVVHLQVLHSAVLFMQLFLHGKQSMALVQAAVHANIQ